MDEVFGYFPPSANPPSKTPMLTLLKQARAYGIGVVLATQNPVDLDYKGLSNAGTWFLGRLQTERDKARVLEGLEGASSATGARFDRQKTEATLAGLDSRVFLMNNVRDDEPVLFHTRWAMSYLRGPLTRAQIKTLMAPRRESGEDGTAPATPATVSSAEISVERDGPAERAGAPAGVEEGFLRPRTRLTDADGLVYRPALLGVARLHFVRATYDLDVWESTALLAPLRERDSRDLWADAAVLAGGEPDLDGIADERARFATLPAEAMRAASYKAWGRELIGHLYRERTISVWKCARPKATSRAGESEGEFRVRLSQLARERRDLDLAKLERRFAPKLARIQERIRKAEQKVERERSQYGQEKMQTAISVGATVIGALFGRKLASAGTVGRATTAMRGAGRSARERGDIARATQDLEAQRQKLVELERDFETEMDKVRDAVDPDSFELDEKAIRPRKSDLTLSRSALVWTPWRVGEDGIAEPLF
jgi:hypothetical protein